MTPIPGARKCPACRGKGKRASWCRLPVNAAGRCPSGHSPTMLARCPSAADPQPCETCDGAGQVMPLAAVLALLEPA